MLLGYIPADSLTKLAEASSRLLPMEPTIRRAPIGIQLASIEHVGRMLDHPCHNGMIVRKPSLDSPLQRHLKGADLIHNLPYSPFG